MNIYGGIEAGGTKFNCIIASDPDHILAEITLPTRSPDLTLSEVIHFFKTSAASLNVSLTALGIACFGPVDLDQGSGTYGHITSTPKVVWQNTPILQILQQELQVPFSFDTDVNGAALGEGQWGAGVGLSDFIYATIGTGIGGGVIVNHQPVHGLVHPELGHILMKHDRVSDPFKGLCPFHEDCLEGLASGPAITSRWGVSTHELPSEHEAWDLEANYLAQAIHNWCLCFSPKRIILGGGVMKVPGLIEKVRSNALRSLNGYVVSKQLLNEIESYIVPPVLGDRAGSLGAIALAIQTTSR